MRPAIRRAIAVLTAPALVTTGLVTTGLVTTGLVTTGLATGSARAADSGPVTAGNLLINPGAQAGAASVQGWDSVTIPGWQIRRGLPTVVRYGTAGFPRAAGSFPAVRGGQLFTGGLGGTAVLTQVIPLRGSHGGPVSAGAGYELSGWLGGSATSHSSVRVTFLSASAAVLGSAVIGPVGRVMIAGHRGLARRSATGLLPAGTASARIDLRLASTAPGADGPYGALRGYNRAVADGLRLIVTAPVRRPARLRPPAARIPRYQHVFLFYLENQDYRALVGDTRRAPFFNSLLARGSLLARLFAEEHPSDANYLALAGGSAFGVPLTDPLEENPLYTIRARNIGDLLTAAGETWKGYLQSADGPCDDTVHRSYWNDDIPMLYFADVRDRPAYCAAHMLPLEALRADLARPATTPAFSWIGSNDCDDMEGCGITAGDRFLKTEIGAIMDSPAWRTQRSLIIITTDEDNYDHPDPPQRVATLLIGSSGVRRGYVSHVRYTHYSLLRTIEAALGLGTLTANDRYAQPVNDVFTRGAGDGPDDRAAHRADQARQRRPAGPAKTVTATAGDSGWSAPGPVPAPATAAPAQAAFVVNAGSGTVTPISLRTMKAARPVKVGANPAAIVAAPDGRTVYVANSGSGTVTPVSTVTLRAGRPVQVGRDPRALAITPDGKTLYVANSGSGTVTPVSTATGLAGRPIPVGRYPRALAVSPDGSVLYVLDWGSAQVTPVRISTGRAGKPIAVGSYPFAIAFSPGGSHAYVASYGADTITPITVATATAGRPVKTGAAPDALAVSPDGRTVYVVSGDGQTLTPVSAVTGVAGHPVRVGYSPAGVALSPSGSTAYVVNTISGTLTPVTTRTGRAGSPIPVGLYGYPTVVALAPGRQLAVVLNTYGGHACLVSTATGKVVAKLKTGGSPVAVAFAR